MPALTVEGSALIGFVKVSSSFDALTIEPGRALLKRFSTIFALRTSEVRSVEISAGLPGFTKAIRFHHDNAVCPRRVIFFCPLDRFVDVEAALRCQAIDKSIGSTTP